MKVSAQFTRDANNVPIDSLGLVSTKSITYAAATTGAVGATTLFTVTGVVAVKVFGVVSGADLTGSGTLEVGITGSTPSIIAQTTGTNLDVGEIWTDNAPSKIENLPTTFFILNGTNIIQTIGTDTITAGTMTYYCIWVPISSDGDVTAA